MALTQEDIAKAKGRGFLRNRGTENFTGRIVPRGARFSAAQVAAIAELSEKYGSGTVGFTSRLCAEVVGIPFEKLGEAEAFAKEHGLIFGGTGAKVRPVTSCKGTTCVYGCYDTQELAAEIFDEFYIGWSNVKLPHKFKIGCGGCPNSCMKPALNDFGVEGRRGGKFCVYVGGTWGKNIRMGTPLAELVNREDILPLIEKSILWFRKYAYAKERFGVAIDRVGFDAFQKELLGDSLLREKDAIFAAEIKTKPNA